MTEALRYLPLVGPLDVVEAAPNCVRAVAAGGRDSAIADPSSRRSRPNDHMLNLGKTGECPQNLRLPAAACRAIDLPGGEAGVGGGKLDVDRGQFGGLAGAAETGLAAEVLQLLQ